MRRCLCVMIAALAPTDWGGPSWAQQKPKTEIKSGVVKEIVDEGRRKTLVVTVEGGGEESFAITPKVDFEVAAAGDAQFVTAGQWVEGKGVFSNGQLFVSEVTVHLLGPGRRPAAGRIVKAPPVAGESMNAWYFNGPIVGREQDANYPEYQRLGVKIAGRIPPIVLEKDFKVAVVSHDPDHAKADMPVELELLPLPGGRYNLVRATVKSPEPFQAEQLLKPERDGK